MFSLSVMSISLWPRGLQYARLPSPPSPGACSNSCPLSQWWHPTILSSVVPFSSCLQSFPTSRSSLMSQLFTSGGQNIGASASAPVLPMNKYSGLISFRIDWFDLAVQETCLWVSWSLWWKHGLTVACCRVRDTYYNSPGACWHKSFWRRSPLPLP